MEYSAKDIYDKTRNALYKYEENAKKYRDKLFETWEELPPLFVTSSEKGIGRDELLGYIAGINQSMKENNMK